MNTLESLRYLKLQQAYGPSIKQPFDINGILMWKDKNEVRIDIGNHKMIEAKLKNPLEAKTGDQVFIDKSQVISMKICENKEEEKKVEKDKYQQILQSWGMEATKEEREAIRTLDQFDMPLTKEGVRTLMVGKHYLDSIQEDLTYDAAIVLSKKAINLEEASLQEVAQNIAETKKEKETVSLLKLLGIKKEMTTEAAEQIAQQIYGSRMGKDITDIIKALHKADVEITKKNIEQVHDVFYKLDKLKKIDNDTFLRIYQKGMTVSIDNLYNVKYYVKESSIPIEEGINDWAAKLYEDNIIQPIKVTDKDLKMLQEQIMSLLDEMGLDADPENIQLAHEMLKEGISLTKDALNEILEMKKALGELIGHLDFEKVSAMIKEKIDIEKQDIREVVKQIKVMEEDVKSMGEGPIDELEEKESIDKIYERLEKLREIKDRDIIKLIKQKADFKLNKIEKIIFHQNTGQEGKLQIGNYRDKITLNGKISISQEWMQSQSVKDQIDEIFAGEATKPIDKFIVKGFERIVNISQVFQKVKQLSFPQIAFHMTKGIPLTLRAIEKSHDTIEQKKNTEAYPPLPPSQEAAIRNYMMTNEKDLGLRNIQNGFMQALQAGRTLIQNNLSLNIPNIQQVLIAYGQYRNIRNDLSMSMVMDSAQENKDLETMALEKLQSYVEAKKQAMGMGTVQEYVDQSIKAQGYTGTEGMDLNRSKQNHRSSSRLERLVEGMNKIGKEKEVILPLLMKNQMDFSLKNIGDVSLFLQNQQQLGQKITEIVQSVGASYIAPWKNHVFKLEKLAKNLSNKLKSGESDLQQSYEHLIGHVKDMKQEMEFSQQEGKDRAKEQIEALNQSFNLQKQLNKHHICLQFPVMQNDQFRNLQIYVQAKGFQKLSSLSPQAVERAGNVPKEEALTVFLQMDTQHLGAVHMALEMNQAGVSLTVGVRGKEEMEKLQNDVPILKEMLSSIGYPLKTVVFKEEELHLLNGMKESHKKPSKGLLNIKL
ncbi:DUF6240 domain-containing protein [Clostridiaceae bacterium 35-E11]